MSIILLLSAIQWMWNHRLLRRSWIFFFFSSKEFKYQKLFSPAKFSFFHSRNKNNNDNSKQNLASKSFVPRTSFILSSTLNSPILSSRNDYSLSSSRSTFPFFFFFRLLQLVSTLLTSSLKSISVFTRSRRDRINARTSATSNRASLKRQRRLCWSLMRSRRLLLSSSSSSFSFSSPPLLFFVRSTIRRVEERIKGGRTERGDRRVGCRAR